MTHRSPKAPKLPKKSSMGQNALNADRTPSIMLKAVRHAQLAAGQRVVTCGEKKSEHRHFIEGYIHGAIDSIGNTDALLQASQQSPKCDESGEECEV